MLIHTVILSLVRSANTEEKQRTIFAAQALMSTIPWISSLKCGFDIGLKGEADTQFSITAEFESADAYERYASHPDHVAFVSTHIKPLLAENGRRAIQYYA